MSRSFATDKSTSKKSPNGALKLTKEQKERIKKLEEEIVQKKEYEKKNRVRKEESSKRTGIPFSMIDMDVVKIGTLLGIIKSKNVLEGERENQQGQKKTLTLLDIFLGDNDVGCNDIFPPYFQNAPRFIQENEKIEYHKKLVHKVCNDFSNFLTNMIETEMKVIGANISITLEKF